MRPKPCTHGRYTTHTDTHACFAAAGPRLWNSLPADLRQADISFEQFKRLLKTFLFGCWDRGALWLTVILRLISSLTYLLTYLLTHTNTTRWGTPYSAKWQNFVTTLFLDIKIPTTKRKIMLHAVSLKGGSRMLTNCVRISWQVGTNWISALLIRQSGSGARIFVRVLKWKADTLNTNWASSLKCCDTYNSSLPDILLNFIICSNAIQ